ncbi:energy-coupling factor transporter transmembrane component T family protein [Fischerella sp. PCC 9605]|uniref:energy-coupling factor transporter transmembrane component T family protein n=1 Tax=Fischerella sp. PCC 9605 TaxID=1173024 RepID=UPI00047B3FAC|nr:energy-coupling factor transporter transmembrane component T [Fischerella sp. PCC 9605]
MTSSRVPVLYQDKDTVIHRRDPRVKIVLFFLLFLYLFLAPNWEWLMVATILGLILAAMSRTPWKWIALLWAIHIPTFITLILVPAGADLLAGDFSKALEAATAELRLVLAWTASIIISISLLSTMDADELTRGLRSLRLPGVVAFAVGLSYRLLYTTLSEAFRIADAMKMKGVDLDPRHFFRFIWNSMKISLPVLFAVLRRGPTLMSALEMRGFLRGRNSGLGKLDLGDVVFLLIGLIVFGLAVCDRFGVLPFSLASLI